MISKHGSEIHFRRKPDHPVTLIEFYRKNVLNKSEWLNSLSAIRLTSLKKTVGAWTVHYKITSLSEY